MKKNIFIKVAALFLVMTLMVGMFSSCTSTTENNKVVIYTSAEDYRVDDLRARLTAQFPDYDIVIEYMSTGNHAAKLVAEGTTTECDITHDLEYGYLAQIQEKGFLADLSEYDTSIFTEDVALSNYYIPELRNGGAIIINPAVLAQKGLEAPTSYEDLLKPEYKNLISMPSPKSSGTGYMFLKNLVNAWGEQEAFDYFDKLTENILQYTSSGSGPVNALVQGEVAIGLGMTAQAVTQINNGEELEIVFFEEGSPYSLYGQGIIKGKETKKAVKEVFDFLYNTYTQEACEKFFPEKIFKDKDFTIENYPTDIKYADMKNNTISEKERLLEAWTH